MRSQLISIRPKIKKATIEIKPGEMASFQNETLRPILKFQNSLLLTIFRDYIKKHKIIFDEFTAAKKKEYIEITIQKDRKIHHVLLGVIIGHFTDIEYCVYIKNEKELNRRTLNLLVQRLQNEL